MRVHVLIQKRQVDPEGLGVAARNFRICARSSSGFIDPAPIKPSPPASLTAAASLQPDTQIIPA